MIVLSVKLASQAGTQCLIGVKYKNSGLDGVKLGNYN